MENRPSFLSRRSFLAAACLACPAAAKSTFRIGVTDWNLKLSSKLEAVALAADLGFQGVEVSLGRTPADGKLPLAEEALQDRYLAAARGRGVALAGTCLDILHVNYLKSDKLGQKWVADGIPITKRLNAKVMLLPFFGKGALGTTAEFDYIGDLLRELGPEAEKSGVILALENTVNAADNLRMLERSRSRAVKIYYDCGNLAHSGFDPIAELQAMGRDRIAQVHLKDNPHYLGEGKINLPRIVQILQEMGYSGFANLETDAPSRDIAADMRRNLAYIRRLTG